MIKYANGTREVMRAPSEQVQVQPPQPQVASTPKQAKRTLGTSVFAFILSVVALFFPIEMIVVALLAEGAALILGISSISRINRYPDFYRGRGFAIAAIVISAIVFSILLLALMVI